MRVLRETGEKSKHENESFFNKPLIIPTRFATNIEREPKSFLLLSW